MSWLGIRYDRDGPAAGGRRTWTHITWSTGRRWAGVVGWTPWTLWLMTGDGTGKEMLLLGGDSDEAEKKRSRATAANGETASRERKIFQWDCRV